MERKEVPKLFFNKEEEKQIVSAVAEAEQKTSAEIVVRLERNCPENPLERCRKLLQSLGIIKTQSRTGLIIYISLEDHKVAVFGDEAVDKAIGRDAWQNICNQIVAGFKEGKPCEALCDAIRTIGEMLSVFLPYKPGDVNELPDELSVAQD